MKWTPDSRFLVFTTTSSGGHSPWHFPAYAFCSDEKEFCDLEPALKEPVTSAEFSVIATDQLSISVRDETADNKDEMGSRKVTISLSNIAAQMRKLTSDNEL